MTRDEILKLHELSDEEQVRWLTRDDVLMDDIPCIDRFGTEYEDIESLADCAFRLRDEASNIGLYVSVVYNQLHLSNAYVPTSEDLSDWFAFHAKPIHWIQAALLAKGETGQ